MDEVTARSKRACSRTRTIIEGWRMLGRTYLVSGDAAKAAFRLRESNSVAPQKDMALCW